MKAVPVGFGKAMREAKGIIRHGESSVFERFLLLMGCTTLSSVVG